ncbi:hypothetical protein EC988_008454, partial [Linderina pennispora]
DHRSELVRSTTARLLALARAGGDVQEMLDDAAVAARVNLAARDSKTGGTLLHIAVQQNNVGLAKWAITQGVDVFAKDGDGALADKYATTPAMTELLGQAPMGNARTALSGSAPKLSGQLHKWTNYASGWKQRWFELEAGVLSYYKDKADADASCRGAINLRIARIVMAKDRTQFEVHGKGSIRYRLKAKDAAVAKQWVHMLNLSKQWALENHKQPAESERTLGYSHRGSISTASVPVDDAVPAEPPVRERSGSQSRQSKAGSAASSILSSESDDELFMARDDFSAALSEVKAQLFLQGQLLDSLQDAAP